MKTKLQELFDMAKLEKRKSPSQKVFEKENRALLLAFGQIVVDALEKLHQHIFTILKPGAGMDNKMPAVSMISFIRTGIVNQFPAYCEKATKSRFKLVTPTQNNVYIKKLNYRKRPSNTATNASDIILYQLTKNMEEKGGNVFLGYTTDKSFSQILGIYAICLDGKELLWETDILTLSKKPEAVIVTMPEPVELAKLKAGTLKTKRRNKKNE